MAVSGTINVSASFIDSSTETSSESTKKITLASADLYESGKVAVVSGTCGTVPVTVPVNLTTYRNASGQLVAMNDATRAAFSASGERFVELVPNDKARLLISRRSSVSVSDIFGTLNDAGFSVSVLDTAGTSAWTLVLYSP